MLREPRMPKHPAPDLKLQDLPDEMPRHLISDDAPARKRDGANHLGAPSVIWMLMGILLVAGFVAALWLLNPASERIGRSSADIVVPAAPAARGP